MRILWVCNIPLPEACELLGLPVIQGGGWMPALAQVLSQADVSLGVLFAEPGCSTAKAEGKQAVYYPVSGSGSIEYAIRDFAPDLIHIHGTESLLGSRVLGLFPSVRWLVSVQGLASECAIHLLDGLSPWQRHSFTLRDLWRHDTMIGLRRRFRRQDRVERAMLTSARYIVGRTSWDHAVVSQMNHIAEYLPCGEMLRGAFYTRRWRLEECERHSIFVPSGSYPLKGLHMALKALAILLTSYPDTVLYVAGRDITASKLPLGLGLTGYGRVIRHIIRRLGLAGHVCFTGMLDEEGMCKRYLSSHVFLLPSSIENSPNSLGEAMILGVPSAAACVGGVPSLLCDRVDGCLYPYDEPYMAAFYISEIFENDAHARRLSAGARARAAAIYDREAIAARMLDIYDHIAKDGSDSGQSHS